MTEDFKRPNHPDFMDASELRKEGFSGVRINSLSQDWEIWIDGERKALGSQADIDAFLTAYKEIFLCKETELQSDGPN